MEALQQLGSLRWRRSGGYIMVGRQAAEAGTAGANGRKWKKLHNQSAPRALTCRVSAERRVILSDEKISLEPERAWYQM